MFYCRVEQRAELSEVGNDNSAALLRVRTNTHAHARSFIPCTFTFHYHRPLVRDVVYDVNATITDTVAGGGVAGSNTGNV